MVHYINTYTETPDKHKEVRWITLNWPLIILFSIASTLLIGALLVGGIYGIAEDNTPLTTYSFIIAGTFAIASIMFPNTIFQHLKMPKTFLEIKSEFLDNEVLVSASNGKTESFKYKQICKVKETEHYFVIIFTETEDLKRYLTVKKDAFTTGDSSTFLHFLSVKG